jgi:p-aminobenzoyl-glutamate transporter AbgT
MVGSIGGTILGFVGILLRDHVLLGIGFAVAGLALIFFAREFAKELVRANSAMPWPLTSRPESEPFTEGLATFIGVVFAVAGVIVAIYGQMQ